MAAQVARHPRLDLALGVERLVRVLPEQLEHALGQRPAALRHPPFEPEQPVEALDQALAGPHAPDLGGARRHPDQPELLRHAHVGVGRVLGGHLQNARDELRRVSLGIRGRRRSLGARPSRP